MSNNWFTSINENITTYSTEQEAIVAAHLLIAEYSEKFMDTQYDNDIDIKVGKFTHKTIQSDLLSNTKNKQYQLVDLTYWLDTSHEAIAQRIGKAEERLAQIEAKQAQQKQEYMTMTPLEKKEKEIHSIQMGNLAKPWIDDDRLAHGIDRDGNAFEYDVSELFWDLERFNYLKTQAEYYNLCLEAFDDELAGKYIIFETGIVIDSDTDRNALIHRVMNSGFLKQKHRPTIFVAHIADSRSDRQALPIDILPHLESDRLIHLFEEFKHLSSRSKDLLFLHICNDRIYNRYEHIKQTENT